MKRFTSGEVVSARTGPWDGVDDKLLVEEGGHRGAPSHAPESRLESQDFGGGRAQRAT